MSDASLEATQAVPFPLGALLAGRYELRVVLGEGGMGAVFAAQDRELDEEIALKVLHRAIAADAAALTRFRREVKLARRVTHRNVARTFDLGAHEGTRFLTMELIAGESLATLAGRQVLTLPDALRVAAEIARGLAAAHAVGVVHRDLKPANVMLADERVVLTDFGIARIADGGEPQRNDALRTGMIVGTPAYMSPEQLENGAIDGRTDVYALGSIVFELLAGRLPFVGDSALAIASQRMTTDAPDVRALVAAVPAGVASLVAEMLARRREDRPDAQAVLDRLEALRGNQAGQVARVASRVPTLEHDAFAGLAAGRVVSVNALAGGGEGNALAATLTSAVFDALVEARVARVVPAGQGADLVVQGSVHAAGERARARLRLLGRRGAAVWAGHVDGALADSLALEDGVVEVVTSAVRAWTASDPGPTEPSLREPYEKARAELSRFALPSVRKAIAILEELEATHPGDPHVRALLARALHSAWAQLGGRDRAMLVRAEELALRALGDDPWLPVAHHVIAQIRAADGEYAAAVRAEVECLRHDPRQAEAHAALGSLLCQGLHVEEGRRRLELAARFGPHAPAVAITRVHSLAMLGDEAEARRLLADLTQRHGALSGIVVMIRAAVWWNDRALAGAAMALIEGAKAGASWDVATHAMQQVISGVFNPAVVPILRELAGNDVARQRRVLMHEIAADLYALVGESERALAEVVEYAKLPSVDLLWLDASPPLASVRGNPRFSEARAVVAARCAELWGSVGPWPE